jgi:hypothetical protein
LKANILIMSRRWFAAVAVAGACFATAAPARADDSATTDPTIELSDAGRPPATPPVTTAPDSYGKADTTDSYGKADTTDSYGKADTTDSYGKADTTDSYGKADDTSSSTDSGGGA